MKFLQDFSSGPTYKGKHYSLDQLQNAILSKSHRHTDSLDRINLLTNMIKNFLQIPDNYHIGIINGSCTAAMECLIWNLTGYNSIQALCWDCFAEDWAYDLQELHSNLQSSLTNNTQKKDTINANLNNNTLNDHKFNDYAFNEHTLNDHASTSSNTVCNLIDHMPEHLHTTQIKLQIHKFDPVTDNLTKIFSTQFTTTDDLLFTWTSTTSGCQPNPNLSTESIHTHDNIKPNKQFATCSTHNNHQACDSTNSHSTQFFSQAHDTNTPCSCCTHSTPQASQAQTSYTDANTSCSCCKPSTQPISEIHDKYTQNNINTNANNHCNNHVYSPSTCFEKHIYDKQIFDKQILDKHSIHHSSDNVSDNVAHHFPFLQTNGLKFCDAAAAAFITPLPFEQLDATAFSLQKGLGSEAGLGIIVLSPKAFQRLSMPALRTIPKLFRLRSISNHASNSHIDTNSPHATTSNIPVQNIETLKCHTSASNSTSGNCSHTNITGSSTAFDSQSSYSNNSSHTSNANIACPGTAFDSQSNYSNNSSNPSFCNSTSCNCSPSNTASPYQSSYSNNSSHTSNANIACPGTAFDYQSNYNNSLHSLHSNSSSGNYPYTKITYPSTSYAYPEVLPNIQTQSTTHTCNMSHNFTSNTAISTNSTPNTLFFQGHTLNTISMLLVEDAITQLEHATKIGQQAYYQQAQNNLKTIQDYIAQSDHLSAVIDAKWQSASSFCLQPKFSNPKYRKWLDPSETNAYKSILDTNTNLTSTQDISFACQTNISQCTHTQTNPKSNSPTLQTEIQNTHQYNSYEANNIHPNYHILDQHNLLTHSPTTHNMPKNSIYTSKNSENFSNNSQMLVDKHFSEAQWAIIKHVAKDSGLTNIIGHPRFKPCWRFWIGPLISTDDILSGLKALEHSLIKYFDNL